MTSPNNKPLRRITVSCNGVEYNRMFYICCENTLFTKYGVTHCCGHGVYYPISGQRCKDGMKSLTIYELDSPESYTNLDPK